MYYIKKRLTVSAAHKLELSYESKCTELHGHNWIIDVYLKSKTLNQDGMILDFTEIKQKISKKLDHKLLNDVIPFNPTAENIAYWIVQELAPFCYRADVQESPNNIATYEKDED